MVNGGQGESRPDKLGGKLPKVECACITCPQNDKSNGKYGYCQKDHITLKWRGALNLDKEGTVVFMECLNFELAE